MRQLIVPFNFFKTSQNDFNAEASHKLKRCWDGPRPSPLTMRQIRWILRFLDRISLFSLDSDQFSVLRLRSYGHSYILWELKFDWISSHIAFVAIGNNWQVYSKDEYIIRDEQWYIGRICLWLMGKSKKLGSLKSFICLLGVLHIESWKIDYWFMMASHFRRFIRFWFEYLLESPELGLNWVQIEFIKQKKFLIFPSIFKIITHHFLQLKKGFDEVLSFFQMFTTKLKIIFVLYTIYISKKN